MQHVLKKKSLMILLLLFFLCHNTNNWSIELYLKAGCWWSRGWCRKSRQGEIHRIALWGRLSGYTFLGSFCLLLTSVWCWSCFRCFVLNTPFLCDVTGGLNCGTISWLFRRSSNSWLWYSPPWCDHRSRILLSRWFSTSSRNSLNFSKVSEFYLIKYIYLYICSSRRWISRRTGNHPWHPCSLVHTHQHLWVPRSRTPSCISCAKGFFVICLVGRSRMFTSVWCWSCFICFILKLALCVLLYPKVGMP